MDPRTPAPPDDLEAALHLEVLRPDTYRGRSPSSRWPRIFGGLVVGQALAAMHRTVAERGAHSFHAYFVLPGDPALPVDYAVERIRDGGSFTTRRCVASQEDRPIFTATASFQRPEDGLGHAAAIPDVPAPEALPDEAEILARFGHAIPSPALRYLRWPRPIELRPVDPPAFLRLRPPASGAGQAVWMRCRRPLPDDPALWTAALGYLSDMTLLDASLLRHGRSVFDPDLQVASLDHALWFHAPCRPDDWLLYVEDAPWAGSGRALVRGQIFSRQGTLVASVAQEGLIRLRPPRDLPKE